jgi:biotin synthase
LLALPFNDLLDRAQRAHRAHHDPNAVQLSTLISIKTGGCPEDCAYCPQAARYATGVANQALLPVGEVVAAAAAAKAAGATRFCMGAAWREVKDGPQFDRVLEMVRGVKQLGLEACCTLGMLTEDQARRLREAGCDAYNHNLDTSREKYGDIVSTRDYDDRLRTLRNVRAAGITVCSGGIIGMGESRKNRAGLIAQLANLPQPPESVPINNLVPIPGTPLADNPPLDPFEFVRTIAAARITMPTSWVRLSAGRQEMSDELQALCFLAGANSMFYGDRLLTTGNPDVDRDDRLFARLGLTAV